MDDIKNDPRFAHIMSDPRFRPMPKSKRKVKIDSRFQSLFTSKHFSHRTDIDKRGRPVLDSTKRNKHVMQRFYELSDNENSQSQSDSESDGQETSQVASTDKKPFIKKKRKATSKSGKTSSFVNSNKTDHSVTKKRKLRETEEEASEEPLQKRRKHGSPAGRVKAQGSSGKRKVAIENGSYESSEDERDSPKLNKDEDDMGADEHEDDDDEEEDSDDDDTELPEFTQEYELEETEVDHKWNELHTDAPIVTDSTHRLAVCNMDWDFVKAQDLFVLFKSFAPEGGHVRSVTIYPSEFGKERMAEEALLGPREIREQAKDDSKAGNDVESGKKKKKGKDQQKLKRSEKDMEAAQTEKLREYQLNRLRYYYAVVDCNSVHTADVIYNECDGREYLMSSVRLDLRFIPDDMTFDDDPKESFSEDQSLLDYQPNRFYSTALSQAKVDVTWDETDFDRLSKRISGMQPKELESIVDENKYSDIIAPPESDSEEESDDRPEWLKRIMSENGEEEDKNKKYTEEEKIQIYRKLLMDKTAEEEEEKGKEEGEIDKEIEWQPGLKSSVEKKIKKKEKKKAENPVVGEYLEKKREKRKKKREGKLKKKIVENEDNEQAFSDDEIPDDFDIDDMKHLLEGETEVEHIGKGNKDKKKKKKKKVIDAEAEEEDAMNDRERAELELMLMDENGGKALSKPDGADITETKKKKKKKNKLAKLKKTEQDKEDFVLDVNDPRFGALYTSHLFHIDPNAPQFKKTKNMEKLVNEQIKRKNKLPKSERSLQGMEVINGSSDTVGSKSMSQSLVESLKRKMKKPKV